MTSSLVKEQYKPIEKRLIHRQHEMASLISTIVISNNIIQGFYYKQFDRALEYVCMYCNIEPFDFNSCGSET